VSDGWLRLPGGDARVLVEDEAFLVLDGDCEFYVDGAASSATRGTFVLGPRGIPHA